MYFIGYNKRMRRLAGLLLVFLAGTAYPQEDKKTLTKYEMELRELEEALENLKTRVIETKKALKVFGDMVLHGTLTGTKIIVAVSNPIYEEVKVHAISILLDGFEVRRIEDAEEIKKIREGEQVVYEEDEVIPGSHSLDVVVETGGKRPFRKRSRYIFVVTKGVATKVLAQLAKSPIAKKIKKSDDMDIKFSVEKLKVLPEVE